MVVDDKWQKALAERQLVIKKQQRWRSRREVVTPQQPVMAFAKPAKSTNTDSVINFSGNDYLGLANHPILINAMQLAAVRWGVGSGASHLVCGHQTPHHQLEEALAEFVGAQRALLFSTGYMANLAIPATLLSKQDLILQDKLNHASLIDGARLSRATLKRYVHNDTQHAAKILNDSVAEKVMLSTDGIFSMDGDCAPLSALKSLVDQHDGLLVVDDAHGVGVMGSSGKGSFELHQLPPKDNVLLMGTFGKGFGSFGAFVAGDEVFIEQLIQGARSYIYTTALPAPMAAVSLASLQLVQTHGEQWRAKLKELITQFRLGAEQLGYQLMPSDSPIQPLVVGSEQAALALSQTLYQQGVNVTAIRPPTVPTGSARLRFTFSAAHTKQQVERLLSILASPAVKALYQNGVNGTVA